MKAFSIGNIAAEPGSVARGRLGSTYLSNGTEVEIPLMVVNGALDGPVLWLSAAMHGQELSGMEVIWDLVHKHLHPSRLRGTVVAAPLLNPLSYAGGTYYTPQDGYNINRVFPGDPKGLTTQRLASLVLEEGIRKVDYLIDFHANPDPAMCFAIIKESQDRGVWDEARAMAKAFGITTVEMVLKLEAHRTGTMIDTANSLGKPALVIELTPWRRVSPVSVRVGVRGALNVMKTLGMIDGEVEPQTDIKVVDGKLTRTEVTASRGGPLRIFKSAGDPISKGEVIAQVVNGYGDPVEDIVSTVDGWLLAYPMMDNQSVGTGEVAAFLLFRKPE